MSSQLSCDNRQFSLQEARNTSIISHAFGSSDPQPVADLNQALKEDRKEIQKEIVMRRNKHVSTKNKGKEQRGSFGNQQKTLPRLDQDQKDGFISTTAIHNPPFRSESMRQDEIGAVHDVNSLNQSLALNPPVALPDLWLCASTGADNQNTLKDLSALYARVIQGTNYMLHLTIILNLFVCSVTPPRGLGLKDSNFQSLIGDIITKFGEEIPLFFS